MLTYDCPNVLNPMVLNMRSCKVKTTERNALILVGTRLEERNEQYNRTIHCIMGKYPGFPYRAEGIVRRSTCSSRIAESDFNIYFKCS